MMNDINLPSLPGAHFKILSNILKKEISHFLTNDFINNRTNINTSLFLEIIKLISLEDFEEKLLNRNKGRLTFIEGTHNEFVKFSSHSVVATFQRIEKPLPVIGRLKIKIHNNLMISFIKISDNSYSINFEDGVEVEFSNPNLNREVRFQKLKSIILNDKVFLYTFENKTLGKPNVNITVDLTLHENELDIYNNSEDVLGIKLAKKICKDKCFQSCDSGTEEVVIGKTSCYEGRSGACKVTFTVDDDNTRIILRVYNIEGITIFNLHTDEKDIHGKREWEVQTDYGGKRIKTRFDKGIYSLTASGRTLRSKWSYDLEVIKIIDAQ